MSHIEFHLYLGLDLIWINLSVRIVVKEVYWITHLKAFSPPYLGINHY